MRLEALTVALRPRSPWEAVELGTALVRRHAAAIWRPWLALTLPVLVLLNLLGWAIGALWLAPVLMWWLKPVFDRIPLYVLSRAVFGETPSTAQTLRAQLRWGARWWPAYLLWRRLGPARALFLPVDLLEGGDGQHARARRSAMGGSAYGVGALLTLVCLNFELALYLGAVAGTLLLVPNDYLPDMARGLWTMLREQPLWLQVALNVVAWLTTTLIEPFYIGAGFGLYLNRRTEVEAWDIELVLRRLRARLLAATAPLASLLLVGALLLPGSGHAQAPSSSSSSQPPASVPLIPGGAGESGRRPTAPVEPAATPTTALCGAGDKTNCLDDIFQPLADDHGLRKAVARAYADPTLAPKRKVSRWVPRDAPAESADKTSPQWLAGLGRVIAVIGEYALWLVFGALALALLLTSPRWWPWLRASVATFGREPVQARQAALPAIEPLPDDIPTAVRRLWQGGQHRQALALLYRASVDAMAQRAGVVLVPGATESQCLRASRQLPLAGDRELFARTVRTWQYAAYAGRLPDAADFDGLLRALTQAFGWAR